MDEIKQRLSNASEACIKAYEAWRAKATDHGARETLQEAVHEMRKVAARVEIELAVSDRKTQGADPIPIPSHRASRRQGSAEMEAPEDDNRANRMPTGSGPQAGQQRRPVHNIRRPSESAPAAAAAEGVPAAGNEAQAAAAPVGEDDGQRRGKPLSLRRSTGETDQG